jgi:hypothetical protein
MILSTQKVLAKVFSILKVDKDDIVFMFQHNFGRHGFEFSNFIFGCLFPNYVPMKESLLEIQYTTE